MALSTLNDVAVSWAEADMTLNVQGGATLSDLDIKSLTCEVVVERGEKRGPGGKLKARTTGQSTPTASAGFHRDGLEVVMAALATAAESAGFVDSAGRAQISKVKFDLIVKHSYPENATIYTIKLLGCHLDKTAFSMAEGVDADIVETDLNPIEIVKVIGGKDVVLL